MKGLTIAILLLSTMTMQAQEGAFQKECSRPATYHQNMVEG